MLFVNVRGAACGKLVPSHAAQLFVGRRPSGSARLLAPRGCQRRPFAARVAGTAIDRVTFSLDGRRLKTAGAAGRDGSFAARIDPRRLRVGRHRLSARVEFVTGAGQAARTFHASFRRCPARKAGGRGPARFTG